MGGAQVLLESGSRATEFEDMVVDSGRSLLPDMMTDASGEHVYTISSSKVGFSPHLPASPPPQPGALIFQPTDGARINSAPQWLRFHEKYERLN